MTEDADIKAARERQRKIAGDLAWLVERIERLKIQIRLEMDGAMMDGAGEIGSKAR